MNIRSKEIIALTLGLISCIPLLSADDTFHVRDSTETPIHFSSPSNFESIRQIDTLTIKVYNDPGAHHIESLLEQQLSPLKFQLENTQNATVQSYIDKFAGNNYRFHLSKMLGLSKYYFPIFEKAFRETGIPIEIKYLSIIESSLNPQAVSRVGATGPWQFMHATAKELDLTINSYVDERKDPVSATYAAAEYLKSAYAYYQDWFLALASYNCGRGNVNKAIKRSGLSNPSYWDIRKFLPTETQNYIPSFMAMYYVLENHEQFGIETPTNLFAENTEVIMVDRQVSLTAVATALSVDENTILSLNPAYKRRTIKGSKNELKRLVVPQVEKHSYSALYAALLGEPANAIQPSVRFAATNKPVQASTRTHSITKGETLEKIALKYDVSIQDLKVWNNLNNHIIVPGQRLKIEQAASSEKVAKPLQYLTHKVKRGDTLSEIAQQYKINNVKTLKAMNNLKSDQLKPGMTLNVQNL